MCGIFFQSSDCPQYEGKCIQRFTCFQNQISNRGPDYLNVVKITKDNHNLIFMASVLWLQGPKLTPQPLQDENSIFVYNGDIFGGSLSDDARKETGDTTLLWDKLKNSLSIPETLNKVQGPYAFVFLNKAERKVYFGRDVYGRRSLLIGKNKSNLVITSVALKGTECNFVELPSIGTFCYNLQDNILEVYPWKSKNKNFSTKHCELEAFLNVNIKIINYCNALCSPSTFREPTLNDLLLIEQIVGCKNIFDTLASNSSWIDKVSTLNKLLEQSVMKRISTQPHFCKHCYSTNETNCEHSQTGVLFSGGVDCAILALLAHKFTSKKLPIDLINVAFDKVPHYLTPDRITGLETLEELKNLCPDRHWNFVEVNVPQSELNRTRAETIADLIYPLDTILDDSLGCALWFASGAKSSNYVSPCRVLLVGMGADELFGGYTRHRAAMTRDNKWRSLHDTLEEDWQNLSHRNLGRDDRVVSDHGRQLRTPYLDEDVVDFVRGLPCWDRTLPLKETPQGIGEKILLRSLAYHLGLKKAAGFKKRALQFGSRIANSKENAHEVSPRL